MTGLIGQAAYEEVDLVFREVLKVQKLRCVEMFAIVTLQSLYPMIVQYHDDL